MASSVCIYLQIHQPFRIDADSNSPKNYFSPKNKEIFKRVAEKSYLPTNKILLNSFKKYKDFKISLSFSGTVLDQMEKFSPETLDSFKTLCNSGHVEVLSETYYHSLAFFYSKSEFEKQVEIHKKKIKKLFGLVPRVFRNTELSYNNNLAKWAEEKGYHGVLTEGWNKYLNNRSPNFLYTPKTTKNIKVILKNYQISDDIAFRFRSVKSALTFVDSIFKSPGDSVNLFLDYETFGEHQWEETGIFKFLQDLPEEIFKRGLTFRTVSETISTFETKGTLNVPKILTWADTERDLTAWAGNQMQKTALKNIYELENLVLETKNRQIIEDWRRLQTSDHFYYMCTKWNTDGDIHAYFSPYKDPQKAHVCFNSVVDDLKSRIEKQINARL